MSGAVVQGLTYTTDVFGDVFLSWTSVSVLTSTFTTNGSFQQPDSMVTQLEVKTVGGGGGGGPAKSTVYGNNGYAGYGGAYADAFFNPASLTYPVPITIGAGGLGGILNGALDVGNPGGDTSFGSYIVSQGGSHYNALIAASTVTGATSYTTENGGYQQTGGTSGNTVHAGAGGGAAQGYGAGPPWPAEPGGAASGGGPGGSGGGTVASSGVSNAANNGLPGSLYGGGGGGGVWGSPSYAGNGGDGAPGVCIIYQTYPAASGFNVYRNGVLLGYTTSLSWIDTVSSGTYTYKIVAVVNGAEAAQAAGTIVVTVSVQPKAISGKFVGSVVFKPAEISQVGDIKPRIWPAKKNNTVQA